jgi:uncharacterized protein (DUF305 family)
MTMNTRILLLATSMLLAAGDVAAQDGKQDNPPLPAICTANSSAVQPQSGERKMPAMDDAHKSMMMGMGEMNSRMMQGMMAKDVDIAFVCGMIPHHEGAIGMAKAELEHGDAPWAKQMAQQIIAAQEKEIAEMRAWLEKQAQ